MRILIDDGMQIKVGTGIGKYSLYLHKELEKALKGKAVVELSQYDKGNSSKQQGRLQYLRYINSRAFYAKSRDMILSILQIMQCHSKKIKERSML